MKLRTSTPAAAITLSSCLLFGIPLVPPDVQAQAHKACSNATLNGSFGFYRTGFTPTGGLSSLGIAIFDGKGNFTGSQNISRAGTYSYDLPIGGTYEIAADCTGKGFQPGGSEFFRIVVTDGGKGYYIFSETAGNATYGVARKIETSDDDD